MLKYIITCLMFFGALLIGLQNINADDPLPNLAPDLGFDVLKVQPPVIKLPEGWMPKPEPELQTVNFVDWLDPKYLVGGGKIDFKAYQAAAIKHSNLGTVTFTGWGTSGGWLIVHPGEDGEWGPDEVLVESTHKPVVIKIQDRWVIRFKKK